MDESGREGGSEPRRSKLQHLYAAIQGVRDEDLRPFDGYQTEFVDDYEPDGDDIGD